MSDVYRVEVRSIVDGQPRTSHADLTFRDGLPFIVLAWKTTDGELRPSLIVGIRAEQLTKIVSDSPLSPHYLYIGSVDGLDLD